MANINWNRHSYKSKLDSDYYATPSKGFDSKWHLANKAKKLKQAQATLTEQRAKIKALRN
tara:strand:- start:5067 stop:5246 length:180 start_codon:yes stop_codon:yes gene_type:complete